MHYSAILCKVDSEGIHLFYVTVPAALVNYIFSSIISLFEKSLKLLGEI